MSRQGSGQAKDLILNLLQKHGHKRLNVFFDGQGDSGQIESIQLDDAYVDDNQLDAIIELEVPIELTGKDWMGDEYKQVVTTFHELVETVVYEMIEEKNPGWENNEGAFGEVLFEVDGQKVTYTHNTRIETFETEEYVY